MSNCSTLTLCDPVTGAKVLVTNPGTADAAGFELPAGTPYAGDLAALVKCAQEGGVELLDCEGNLIAATDRVVTWEQLQNYDRGHVVPFVDSGDGCTPAAIVDCPSDLYATTTDPQGGTWQWVNGAWSVICHGFMMRHFGEQQPVATIVLADVGNTWTEDPAPLCLTVTNPHPCADAIGIFAAQVGGFEFIGNAGESVQLQMQWSTDGGATWNSDDWVRTELAADRFRDDAIHIAQQRFNLGPLESTDICVRYRYRTPTFTDGGEVRFNAANGYVIRADVFAGGC